MASIVRLEKTVSFAEINGQFLVSLLRDESKTTKKPAERCCSKEAKCELVDYQSLPNFLKHNEFIIGYYRSEWPLKQTILSIFSIHNETINIWTHLIGFFVFLALATTMMVSMVDTSTTDSTLPSANSTSVHYGLLVLPASFHVNQTNTASSNESVEPEVTMQPIARWPFYAYLGGAMFCLLMSSACHLLSCHSEHTCHLLSRFDYGGISALIVTSFYPLVYYTFACDPFIRNLYMGFITVIGVATILFSLVPVFETPEFRVVRAVLFASMGLSGLVPIVHKMVVFGHQPEAIITAGYEMVMLCFYGIGVIVYALRIPERWMPGMFDLIGNSHQLWHVLVIAGAYTHYLAGLVYLSWREMEGCH